MRGTRTREEGCGGSKADAADVPAKPSPTSVLEQVPTPTAAAVKGTSAHVIHAKSAKDIAPLSSPSVSRPPSVFSLRSSRSAAAAEAVKTLSLKPYDSVTRRLEALAGITTPSIDDKALATATMPGVDALAALEAVVARLERVAQGGGSGAERV